MSLLIEQFDPSYAQLHALVIAIDEYHDLGKLGTAVRGADQLAEKLRTSFNFNVQLLLNDNATREGILGWFGSLKRTCGPNDGVVFYFAGHGLTERGPSGKVESGYLALANTEKEKFETALSMVELIPRINVLPAKHVLIIIDACFSGFILLNSRAEEEYLNKKFTETLMGKPFRYAITAGGIEAVDDNGSEDGSLSLFTYYLLQGLDGACAETVSSGNRIIRLGFR